MCVGILSYIKKGLECIRPFLAEGGDKQLKIFI